MITNEKEIASFVKEGKHRNFKDTETLDLDNLASTISYIKKCIKCFGDITEEETKQKIIIPLFTSLGYNLTEDIKFEYGCNNLRADIFLKTIKGNHILVEVKKLRHNLNYIDEKQIETYRLKCSKSVKYCILTNGIEYIIYPFMEGIEAPTKIINFDVFSIDDIIKGITRLQYDDRVNLSELGKKTKSNRVVDFGCKTLKDIDIKEIDSIEINGIVIRGNYIENIVTNVLGIIHNKFNKNVHEIINKVFDEKDTYSIQHGRKYSDSIESYKYIHIEEYNITVGVITKNNGVIDFVDSICSACGITRYDLGIKVHIKGGN